MKRRLAPQTQTLEGYDLIEQMAFLSGWSPTRGRGRWRTWAEYLRDYRRLRPALMAQFRTGPRAGFQPLFGDRAQTYLEQHGAAALERADYKQIRYPDDHPTERRA